jgi:hypothetical protein
LAAAALAGSCSVKCSSASPCAARVAAAFSPGVSSVWSPPCPPPCSLSCPGFLAAAAKRFLDWQSGGSARCGPRLARRHAPYRAQDSWLQQQAVLRLAEWGVSSVWSPPCPPPCSLSCPGFLAAAAGKGGWAQLGCRAAFSEHTSGNSVLVCHPGGIVACQLTGTLFLWFGHMYTQAF